MMLNGKLGCMCINSYDSPLISPLNPTPGLLVGNFPEMSNYL